MLIKNRQIYSALKSLLNYQIDANFVDLIKETLVSCKVNQKVFNELKESSKIIFFVFLIKRFNLFPKKNKKIQTSVFENEISPKNFKLKSNCNKFSLLDTIFNKVFRKCFEMYIGQLNQERLMAFATKKNNIQKNVNKVFWYLFYRDCDKKEEDENHCKEFEYFFKSFACVKHTDRKNKVVIQNQQNTFKYLSVVFRYANIKKWLHLLKKNEVFMENLGLVKKEIVKEYLSKTCESKLKNFKNLKDESFKTLNLENTIINTLKHILKYKRSSNFELNSVKIRHHLRLIKCPFTLDDYLAVFNLI